MMRNAFWMNRKLYFLMRFPHLVLVVVIFNTSVQTITKTLIKYLEKNLMVTS
uniref:Alternative protein GJA9 n=1 Tax=Homo sapiens TaxID=9606 RepID=L8EB75_HUMAN|nr:alternative protein GJA9 [Homo sapiens]